MTTGELIKQERKKAGLTQQELADKLGIKFVGISQWENGLRNPKLETINRIAEALNIPISALIVNYDEVKYKNTHFILQKESDIISQLASIAIDNYNNSRPSAFIPTKSEIETLKAIIKICNQNEN